MIKVQMSRAIDLEHESQIVDVKRDLFSQCQALDATIKTIVEKLEESECYVKDRILNSLDKEYTDTFGKFKPGPVGELPIHQCLLLDLEELATLIIEKYFNSPEKISMPYTNDLDPWRSRNDSKIEWEDGLFTGETALHIAIAKEDVWRVQYLLEKGADISARATGTFFQPKWLPPLSHMLTPSQQVFAWLGNIKQNKFTMLKQEHNPDSACYYGELPLSFAASIGSVEICRLLYLKHCDVDSNDGIFLRANSDSIPSDILWKRDPQPEKVNKINKLETSPGQLIRCLKHGSVKHGSVGGSRARSDLAQKSVLTVDLWGDKTFLEQNKIKNMEKKLQDRLWLFVNAVDLFGNTAMHLAVLHGQKQVVDWLMQIEVGRDSLDVANCLGFTPLKLATRWGNLDMFDHILNSYMTKVVWQYGKVLKKTIDLRHVSDQHNQR
jgi:ankyrin repeat protein